MKNETLARLADAEERIAYLEQRLDASEAEVARLQKENGNLAFLNSCLRDDLARVSTKAAKAARASNDELKPTPELLQFLASK